MFIYNILTNNVFHCLFASTSQSTSLHNIWNSSPITPSTLPSMYYCWWPQFWAFIVNIFSCITFCVRTSTRHFRPYIPIQKCYVLVSCTVPHSFLHHRKIAIIYSTFFFWRWTIILSFYQSHRNNSYRRRGIFKTCY